MTVPAIAAVRARVLSPASLPPLLAALSVLLVHDIGYLLRAPYWVDESWVAISRNFPIGDLPRTTSSTPIGWSLLLRLFPDAGQSARLITLAFAGAATAAAWFFGRGLGWRNRGVATSAGAATVLATLLVPGMLTRDDLKQYTADAFIALVLLTLTSRLEREWSRRNLALFAGSAVTGMLVSHTTAFVAPAALLGMGLVLARRRAWVHLRELAVAAAGALVLMGVVYLSFDARAVVPGLTTYWEHYYVPVGDGVQATTRFLRDGFGSMHTALGLGPAWVSLPLFAAGLATLSRVGRPMTAAAVGVLIPEMIVMSAAKKYPMFDVRTSTFLIVTFVTVAAIGVIGCCLALARWAGPASALLGVLAAGLFVLGSSGHVDAHPIPYEDARSQIGYVKAHVAAGDVILVSAPANWAFAYYWHHGPLARTETTTNLQGYVVRFPTQPQIVVASDRNESGVSAALRLAVAQAHQVPGARIWLVRIHGSPVEDAAWRVALGTARVFPHQVDHAGLAVIVPR